MSRFLSGSAAKQAAGQLRRASCRLVAPPESFFVEREIGQAIGPDYTWNEAIAGMVSETIYVPLAAYVTRWFLGAG